MPGTLEETAETQTVGAVTIDELGVYADLTLQRMRESASCGTIDKRLALKMAGETLKGFGIGEETLRPAALLTYLGNRSEIRVYRRNGAFYELPSEEELSQRQSLNIKPRLP